jgi:thiol-disulfide isomerase/thioredoxin
MKMKNNLIIIFAAVFMGVAGFYTRHRVIAPTTDIVAAGNLLNTTLPDIKGQPQTLNHWQGKILIINFWATWCPPCLTEIPEFMTLQAEYANQNVQFIGIAVDEKDAVLAFNAKMKVNYPLLMAGNEGVMLSKDWGNTLESVPFTAIINPQGQIIHRQLGEMNRAELLNVIQPLLAR